MNKNWFHNKYYYKKEKLNDNSESCLSYGVLRQMHFIHARKEDLEWNLILTLN